MLSRSCSDLRLKTTLSPSPATIITGSVRFRLAIAVYIHKRTAAGSIVTECDRDPTVAHIVGCEARQCEGCSRFAGCRRVQRQAREAARAFIVRPCDIEVLRRETPNCRIVAGVETENRTPDVRRSGTVIDKKRI